MEYQFSFLNRSHSAAYAARLEGNWEGEEEGDVYTLCDNGAEANSSICSSRFLHSEIQIPKMRDLVGRQVAVEKRCRSIKRNPVTDKKIATRMQRCTVHW